MIVLNVRDNINVKGDGVHDDTAGIQSVIDEALAGGADVYIPSGNYLLSAPLHAVGGGAGGPGYGIRIFGDGMPNTNLIKNFNGSYLFKIESCWYFRFENMRLTGLRYAAPYAIGEGDLLKITTCLNGVIEAVDLYQLSGGSGILLDGGTCYNNSIISCGTSTFRIPISPTTGITCSAANETKVFGGYFTANGHGIKVLSADNVACFGVNFENSATAGVLLDVLPGGSFPEAQLFGCRFENCGYGIEIANVNAVVSALGCALATLHNPVNAPKVVSVNGNSATPTELGQYTTWLNGRLKAEYAGADVRLYAVNKSGSATQLLVKSDGSITLDAGAGPLYLGPATQYNYSPGAVIYAPNLASDTFQLHKTGSGKVATYGTGGLEVVEGPLKVNTTVDFPAGYGLVRRLSTTINAADISTAGTTYTYSITGLPANCMVLGVLAHIFTVFAAPSLTALDVKVGRSGSTAELMSSVSLTSAGMRGNGLAPLYCDTYAPIATFISAGANLNALTAGQVKIYVYYFVTP